MDALRNNSVKDKCIYCGHEGKMSREHYLPRCLGRFQGHEPLGDRMCKKCNESFSELDEQFCRSGPEAIVRDMLGVEGRKTHRKISPFQRASAGADRLKFSTQARGEAAEIELDVDRKSRTVRRLRKIIFTDSSRSIEILITDDMKEPGQLLAKMKERGVFVERPEGSEAEEVTARITGATEEEIPWLRYLLTAVKENMIGEPRFHVGGQEEEARVQMGANPTEKYFRGLAKIAFHYFLKHIGGFRGSEDAFSGIRNFITQGRREDVDTFVSGRQSHLKTDIIPGEEPVEGYRHVLFALCSYERIICKMQFFIHPKYSSPIYRVERYTLPIYTVNLGRNPSRIAYERACSHSFTYFGKDEVAGYDGIMREEKVVPR
jgi:hypothetical protein